MPHKPVIISSSELWSLQARGNLGVAASQAAHNLSSEYGVFTRTRQQAMEHHRPQWLEPLKAVGPLEEGRDTTELLEYVEDVCSQSNGIIPVEKQWIKNDASRIAEEARAHAKAGRRSSGAGIAASMSPAGSGCLMQPSQQASSSTNTPARSASPAPDASFLDAQEWHQELRPTPQQPTLPARRHTSRREQGTVTQTRTASDGAPSTAPGVTPGVRASLLSMRGMCEMNKLGVGPLGQAPPTSGSQHGGHSPLPSVLADKLKGLGLTAEAFNGMMSKLSQASDALPSSMRQGLVTGQLQPPPAAAAVAASAVTVGHAAQDIMPAKVEVASTAVHTTEHAGKSSGLDATQPPASSRQLKERTMTSRWNI